MRLLCRTYSWIKYLLLAILFFHTLIFLAFILDLSSGGVTHLYIENFNTALLTVFSSIVVCTLCMVSTAVAVVKNHGQSVAELLSYLATYACVFSFWLNADEMHALEALIILIIANGLSTIFYFLFYAILNYAGKQNDKADTGSQ